MVACGIATRFLKKLGEKDKADKLVKDIFAAKSPDDARALITEATNGSIQFVSGNGWDE